MTWQFVCMERRNRECIRKRNVVKDAVHQGKSIGGNDYVTELQRTTPVYPLATQGFIEALQMFTMRQPLR